MFVVEVCVCVCVDEVEFNYPLNVDILNVYVCLFLNIRDCLFDVSFMFLSDS